MKAALHSIRACVCLSFFLGSISLSPQPSLATTLTVGISDLGSVTSIAPDGQPDGVMGDLLSEIARQEDWTLTTEPCEWPDCMRKLQAGEIDLLPAVALTPDRMAFLSYNQTPVLQTWTQVYARPDTNIRTIEDLNGQRVTILSGSIQYRYLETLLRSLGARARLIPSDTLNEGFQLVQAGQADAVAADFISGSSASEKYHLEATPIIFLPSGLYFAAPKGRHADVLQMIDHYLSTWKADPESIYYRILSRWNSPGVRSVESVMHRYGTQFVIAASLTALLALITAGLVYSQSRRRIRRMQTAGRHLATVLDRTSDLICIEDRDRHGRYANSPYRDFFGLPVSPPRPAPDLSRISPSIETHGITEADLPALMRGKTLVTREQRVSARTGRTHTFHVFKTALPARVDAERMFCTLRTDITALDQARDLAHHHASHDPLTDLPNRILLQDQLKQLLLGTQPEKGCSAVLVLDLDGFKKINDSHGHAIGDQILREVARRLRAHTPERDRVSRISGDEFMVLLTQLDTDPSAGTHEALRIAERLRLALFSTPMALGRQTSVVTASIGLVMLRIGSTTVGDVIREADLAMQRAKHRGGNQIVLYDFTLQTELEQRLWMEKDLTMALNTRQLVMYSQPQYARDGRMTGMELLVRWTHPDRGPIPPALFVPLAEATSLINHLTAWSLDVACQALLELQGLGEIYPLSINLSPKVLMDPGFGETVRNLLKRTGAPGNRLIFEITEGIWIQDVEVTARRMRELNHLGIRFSVDDFGTGYSNLSSLMRLPISELKIDESLIRNLPDDPDSIAIARLILAMASQLDFWVVAEGVENEPQADFLARHGCDAMQGYLLAHPMPIADWLNTVRSRRAGSS